MNGHWLWFYSPSTTKVYQRGAHIWREYVQGQTRSTYRSPSDFRLTPFALPTDLHRATIHHFTIRDIYYSVELVCYGLHDLVVRPNPPTSILTLWQQAQTDSQWTADSVTLRGRESLLAQSLREGTLRVISDGSYKHRRGTAAILLTNPDRTATLLAKCHVPGPATSQSAYRSELTGILCGVQLCCWLGEIHHLSTCVTFGCDGEAALNKSLRYSSTDPTSPHFDILSSIHALRASSPLTWRPRHILGHQDKKAPWRKLDWWERRNLYVDSQAQAYRRVLEKAGTPHINPRLPSEPWSLFIHGEKQTHIDKSVIMEKVTLPPLLHYWESKRHRYHSGTQDLIDWTAIHKAMRQSPDGLRRWVTKQVTGMCGVGKFLKRWGESPSDACPLCGQPEDTRHVLSCQDPRALLFWNDRYEKLSTWMRSSQTHPEIQHSFLLLLNCWRHNTPCNLSFPQTIRRAVSAQRRIGIQGLSEGLLSTDWAVLQQEYYQSIGSRRSGHRWASLLISELWVMGMKVWDFRNDVMHSPESVQSKAEAAKTDRAVRMEFEAGSSTLPASTQHLFSMSLTTLLSQSHVSKHHWLQTVRTARAAQRLGQRRSRLQRRRFVAYFAQTGGSSDP